MVLIIYCFIGCKEKASTWYSNGSPMAVTLGQQYDFGEKPTVILYTYGPMTLISYIITTFLIIMYQELHCLLFCFVGWPCMAISVSVQYDGGFLLDIILLTQGTTIGEPI